MATKAELKAENDRLRGYIAVVATRRGPDQRVADLELLVAKAHYDVECLTFKVAELTADRDEHARSAEHWHEVARKGFSELLDGARRIMGEHVDYPGQGVEFAIDPERTGGTGWGGAKGVADNGTINVGPATLRDEASTRGGYMGGGFVAGRRRRG